MVAEHVPVTVVAVVVGVVPELAGAPDVVGVVPELVVTPEEPEDPLLTPGEDAAPGNGNWMLWRRDCFCALTIPL